MPSDRPDASGEVDDIVHDHVPHCLAGQADAMRSLPRSMRSLSAALFPEQLAIRRGEAVKEAVIADDEDSFLAHRRSKANGCAGKECPVFLAGRRVQGVDLAVGRATK